MKYMRRDHGFTLVEVLVYVSVLAITAGLLTAVLTNTLRLRTREANSTELSQQLNFVMETVQTLVNESSAIDAVYQTNEADIDDQSTPCTSSSTYCTVKLRFDADNIDPTWVQSTADGVNLVRGDDGETDGSLDNATEAQLTSANIDITYLRFTKFTFDGGHDSVEIDMAFAIDDGRPQFAVTRSLRSAIGRATAAVFDDHLLPGADATYDVGQVSGNKRWQDGAFSRNVTIGGDLTVDTNTLFVDSGDNNVGIGTTGPSEKLHLYGDTPALRIETSNPITDVGGTEELASIEFAATKNNLTAVSAIITARQDGNTWSGVDINNKPTRLEFYTEDNSATTSLGTPRMVIDQNGNVGIGTTNPAEKLEVSGNSLLQNTNIIKWKDSGGTAQSVLRVGTDDIVTIRSAKSGGTAFEIEDNAGSPLVTVADGGRTTLKGLLNLGGNNILNIASGAITVTQSYHQVNTEADAATDDLDTINGGTEGDILILRSQTGARDPTIRDVSVGGGNIQTAGNASFTFAIANDTIMFVFGESFWHEISRSTN